MIRLNDIFVIVLDRSCKMKESSRFGKKMEFKSLLMFLRFGFYNRYNI